jgi:hypothetical protein
MTDTNYDPLKRPQHSTAELKKLFTGDTRVLQRLKNENPQKYEEYRKQAEGLGIIAPRPVWADPNYRDKFNEPPLTAEQIELRAKVPLSEVDRYYSTPSAGNSDTLSRLATADPEKYKLIRAAAMEYGRIPKQEIPRVEVKAPEHETLFTVSDENCQRLGLAKGTKVPQEQFLKIAEIVYNVDEAKAKAEAQAAKDAAVDKSLESVGRIVEPTDAVELARAYSEKKAA